MIDSTIDIAHKKVYPEQRIVQIQSTLIEVYKTIIGSIFSWPDFKIKTFSIKKSIKVEEDFKKGLIAELTFK